MDLFLDSGAFSAWSKGTNIDINQYMDFVKKYEKHIGVYANLDVIGDDKATWKNQKIMEDNGLKPLPVFHVEDNFKYLDRCLEYDHFCLGGMAGEVSGIRVKFLDKCFNVICDQPSRLPKSKVHGFGMTSLKLMLRYPWYSVDSTSWVMTSRFGSVYVPKIKGGKYIYDDDSLKICLSSRSPSTKEYGKTLSSFSPLLKVVILQYFKEKGYSLGRSRFFKRPEDYELKENESFVSKVDDDGMREVERVVERGLCNDYKLRDEMNIIYFMDLEKSIPEWPWPFTKGSKRRFGLS